MKIILVILFSSLILQEMCNAKLTKKNGIEYRRYENSDKKYRLPVEYEVLQYDLSLKPYFDTGDSNAFTFDGNIVIHIKPLHDKNNKIIFHKKNLTIEDNVVAVQSKEGKYVSINSTKYNEVYDFYTINLNEFLEKKSEYKIIIAEYKGFLQTNMEGFYRSSYMENNVTKWLATTQFEPIYARKAFPCFDEPRFKAVFNISITRPATMSNTLSNMPITRQVTKDNITTDYFHLTPKMSTYLVAIIVSEFKSPNYNNQTGSGFGVWSRPQLGSQSKHAFDVGRKILSKMNEFTNISYYTINKNMKMDEAAIPDFSAGAMENWGLLTYREENLMYDKEESSVRYKQRVCIMLAHELSHQWFGDYLTCHWWSDLWLNEGFARFFEHLLPDKIGENFHMEDQFLVNTVQGVLQYDTSEYSVPLTNEQVNSPDEINDFFGTITYDKGASIITMIKYWIGEETFQKGLQNYLDSRKYGITDPKYLFDKLQEAADKDGSIKKYNVTVQKVMESWTSQSGYPLIYVKVDMKSENVTISQSRFKKDGSKQQDTLYNIPISYTTDDKFSFDDTKPDFVLTEKTKTFKRGSSGHGWVMLNKKARGYYRVNYDDHTWDMIKSSLEKNRTKIDRLNRAQIVDDLFHLSREGVISYSKMFSVLQFLEKEVDYAPWMAAIDGFSFLRSRLTEENDARHLIEKHMMNLMGAVLNDLGPKEKPNESHLKKILRMNIFQTACELGHEQCISTSKELFKKLMTSNKMVPPNLREFVYCNALRHGSDAEYDYLRKKFDNTNVPSEKIVILRALGCTKQKKKIYEFLTKSMTMKQQDQLDAFGSALNGNSENAVVVLEYVKKNIALLKKSYAQQDFNSAISNLAGKLLHDKLNEMKSFITSSKDLTDDEKTSFKNSIEGVKSNLQWAEKHKGKIIEWLKNKYSNNSAVNITLSSALLMLALFFLKTIS